MQQYYKVLAADLTHNGLRYKLGLNVDVNEFNDKECQNGLHFADEKQLAKWLDYGTHLAFISIPPDARTVHFADKSKADRIVIDKIITLADWDMWDDPIFCMSIVQQNGESLKYVKEQTPEICLAAVLQNGYALKHVREQTDEICIAAVRQNGFALKHVREQTPKICITAVARNGFALKYVQ